MTPDTCDSGYCYGFFFAGLKRVSYKVSVEGFGSWLSGLRLRTKRNAS